MTASPFPAPDLDALARWLADQRWFGAKASGVPELTLLDLVPLGGDPPIALAVVEAGKDAAGPLHYQVVLEHDPATGAVRPDALCDLPGARRFVAELAASRRHDAGGATVSFRWLDAVPRPQGTDVRRFGGEQSNTSLLVDDTHIVKVFRRLVPGTNPELEVLRVLARRGFDGTPSVAGWAELGHGGDEPTTLAVAQELVSRGRDGWEHVLDRLVTDPGASLAELRDLGCTVGRLHSVLAEVDDDPDFAPRDPDARAWQRLPRTVADDLRALVLSHPGHREVAALEDLADALERRLDAMVDASIGGCWIRVHGDLHLGQTLLIPGGWKILDFEGEPARPLEERRRHQPALRDVAGMLRSFAYAAATHGRHTGRPAPPGWEAGARAAFLDGYVTTVDPVLLPPTAAGVRAQLTVLEIDKAVYELGYELGNRPDWAAIPARGLRRLLEPDPR
ncbi:MAG: hypothetical protein HYX34_07645 [Actinobacteria bacterium]|nr:hypothetical protein [Actinomycetota bacterium]